MTSTTTIKRPNYTITEDPISESLRVSSNSGRNYVIITKRRITDLQIKEPTMAMQILIPALEHADGFGSDVSKRLRQIADMETDTATVGQDAMIAFHDWFVKIKARIDINT
mgnify:CR=1 FL=1